MKKPAYLSLGASGSHAPYFELGISPPDHCDWVHLPLNAIEKWSPEKDRIYERVYFDLRSFDAATLESHESLEAWKASLNALLQKLVFGEGRVPRLVGYSDKKTWEHGVLAVKLGLRDLVSFDELHGELAARKHALNETAEVISFPLRIQTTAPSSPPLLETVASLPTPSTIPFPIDGLEGNSVTIEVVRNTIRKSAPTSSSVLIVGPTGSGKERVALALHRYSPRAAKPFQIFDCAAISPELFESELFGHVAGAFTGASQARKGALELAHEGTLFIDQIHLLAMEHQAKLLRVLQDKKYSPVGSETVFRSDLRIVASSQIPLEELVHAGRFREDLYFRLKVIDVSLPALSERRTDIPVIAQSVLKKLAKENKKPLLQLDGPSLEKILLYDWPGNIRELQNAMERACTLTWSEGRTEIHLNDLPENIQFAVMKNFKTQALKDAVKRFEQEYIAQTVRRFGGSKEEAADALGLSLATLYRKLGAG